MLASIDTNCCCLGSRATASGVSPEFHISVPGRVDGYTPRVDLACQLRRSWRSSCQLPSFAFHKSSLLYSAISWTQASGTALTHADTIICTPVSDRSRASGPLASFMHQMCCSLNVVCVSIQAHRHLVAFQSNLPKLFASRVFADTFGVR